LQIIPRDRWQRVQEQLDRNITFSPRNEKHAYLLKGLVQCGGCGARYVGEPCHGKFYYRCIKRCKKNPTIREKALDDAVKESIRSIMTNPEVIIAPLRELDEAVAQERKSSESNDERIAAEGKKLKIEEDRLLEAYRQSIISPVQLGQQLEQIAAVRAALDLEATTLTADDSPSSEEVGKTVTEYCGEASKRMENFTPEQWREFLRIIVETITFRDNRIAIRGRIAVSPASAISTADLRLTSAGERQSPRLNTKRMILNCEGTVQLSPQTKNRG
jgi:hypothetical protein